MECLEIARLQDFARYTPELLGALSAPDPLPRDARLAMRVDEPPSGGLGISYHNLTI